MTRALPPFTNEVARLGAWLGAEATLALVEMAGGTRIYIPRTATEDCSLAALVGLPAATLLCQAWGGDYLRVPVAREWRILILSAQGKTYSEIARTVKCSENTVWRTLNRRNLTESQLDFFA